MISGIIIIMKKHYKVSEEKWFVRGFFIWMIIEIVSAETPSPLPTSVREHKVHNIMLHPEKHSWCKPTPIKQVVTHPGCRSIDMENHICVGACFSFSVPRTIPETPGDDQLYYCDSCQPHVVSWTTVLLECPDTPMREPVSKMVEVISNCTCTTFRNIEMYEKQVTSSSFPIDDEDPPEVDAGGAKKEDDEEDNSLPEINDFITRREKLKLKPILTPLSIGAVHAVKNSNQIDVSSLTNLSQLAITPEAWPQVVDNIPISNGNTSSTIRPTSQSKFSHSEQLLQFQDLSSEMVDKSEMQTEEVIEEQ